MGNFRCTDSHPNYWFTLYTQEALQLYSAVSTFSYPRVRLLNVNLCSRSIPLAMMCDLLAGQKQRLWRVCSACRRCGAKPASSSRTPVTLRILCWPSSANERLTSSLSHRPSRLAPPPTEVVLTLAALDTGTDTKAWRKLFWESQEMNQTEQKSFISDCSLDAASELPQCRCEGRFCFCHL